MTLSVTFVILATVFTVCLITSNIFVPRTWKLWSLPLQLSGAVVIFPLSYIVMTSSPKSTATGRPSS